jgi:Spy/CpxP family protein refolding chaperone
MKRNLILSIMACGASLALCPALHAQDAAPAPSTTGTDAGAHPWAHHGDMLARLTKQLDLTDDQQTKLKPILEAGHTQMQTIHQDSTLSQQDKMAKMKDARESLNSQINAVLTPDQQTKFAAMQEKMRNHRHGGGGPDAGGAPAAPSATP